MNVNAGGWLMSEAIPCALALSPRARASIKNQRPRCIWLTGLSGAGKSTLANALEVELNARGLHTYVLDGDNLRGGLCRDLGMSAGDRSENVRRIAEVARLMVDAGLVVIVSAISPFRADREAARQMFAPGEFFTVYVSTPFDACARRDPKGLYRAALEGRIRNFTGLDSPYEPPLEADWEVNTEATALPLAVHELLGFVLSN